MDLHTHSLSKMILCRSHCGHCGKIIRFFGLRCRICRTKFHKKCSDLTCINCFEIATANRKTGFFRRGFSDRKKNTYNINTLLKKCHNDSVTTMGYRLAAQNTYMDMRAESPFSPIRNSSSQNSQQIPITHCGTSPTTLDELCAYRVHEENFRNRWYLPSNSTQLISHQTHNAVPSIVSSGYSSVNHSCSTSAGTGSQRSRSPTPDHCETVREENTASPRFGDRLLACKTLASHTTGGNYDIQNSYHGSTSIKDSSVFYMESDDESSGGLDENDNYARLRQRPEGLQRVLRELEIRYSDVEIEQKLGVGPNGPVYRGRWHGDVIVHTRQTSKQFEVEEFRKEVALLSTIRHENVMLFMGACLKPPNLAVVTSLRKCVSVHNYLHCQESRLTISSRLNVMLQVAQGMSYLHAKYITVPCLQTMNIYLDSKVKLCINGYTYLHHQVKREGYGSVPQGHLTYLAPEVITKVNVDLSTGKIVDATSRNRAMDVYAFGTVMYEILTDKWPFESLCPETVIWMIGKGLPQSLAKVKGPDTVKDLIKSCWSHDPAQRPSFVKITQILKQNNISTNYISRRHSFSEPEKIHCVGKSADLCHIKRI